MKTIFGKDVFESVEEIVSAEHTALLIIDMQNGLAAPKGYASRQGDVSIQHQRSIIPNIQRLLGAARSSGVAVIHVKVVFDFNMGSTSPASIYDGHRMRNFGSYWGHPPSKQRESDLETLVDDTWESEFIPELFHLSLLLEAALPNLLFYFFYQTFNIFPFISYAHFITKILSF